jgi:hypothetical protein
MWYPLRSRCRTGCQIFVERIAPFWLCLVSSGKKAQMACPAASRHDRSTDLPPMVSGLSALIWHASGYSEMVRGRERMSRCIASICTAMCLGARLRRGAMGAVYFCTAIRISQIRSDDEQHVRAGDIVKLRIDDVCPLPGQWARFHQTCHATSICRRGPRTSYHLRDITVPGELVFVRRPSLSSSVERQMSCNSVLNIFATGGCLLTGLIHCRETMPGLLFLSAARCSAYGQSLHRDAQKRENAFRRWKRALAPHSM